MAIFRLQVIVQSAAPHDQPVDHITNTFFLEDQGAILNDPAQLAQDAANLWAARPGYPVNVTGILVNAYDMGHTMPREIVGSGSAVPVTSGNPQCREVACCLSFYSERNIPRRRGRLYLGPYNTGTSGLQVPVSAQNDAMAIGAGIANLGGIDVDWKIFSPTANAYHTVTNYWCDNDWDIMRSRGVVSTNRLTATTSEA